MQTEDCEWTSEDHKKLLQAMKDNISERDRMYAYVKGQRSLDWNKIAFHPHSSQACKEKWTQISHKLRKVRTLTELIDDAEESLDNPLKNKKINPEFPKYHSAPNNIFVSEKWSKYRKKHPELKQTQLLVLLNKQYSELPDEKKAKYVKKSRDSVQEFKKNLQQFRTKFPEGPKKKKTRTADLDKQHEQEVLEASLESSEKGGPPPPPPM